MASVANSSSSSYQVPMNVLSTKTLKLISESLDNLMVLPAENGLLRDWRGLAELCGINVNFIEKDQHPAEKLFQLIQCQEQDTCSIQQILLHLETLDRYDIIDDYKQDIDADIEQSLSIQTAIKQESVKQESYDAMVLYADYDIEFAFKIVDTMEKNFNLKMFVQERNLVAGDKEVQATLSVIADHSNKLIVVLSPHFLTSPMNEFFLDYAQTVAIEQKVRKIIPCMLTRCRLPPQLLGLHTLTYTTNTHWGNFWTKLAHAINPELKNMTDPVVPSKANSICRSTSYQSSSVTLPPSPQHITSISNSIETSPTLMVSCTPNALQVNSSPTTPTTPVSISYNTPGASTSKVSNEEAALISTNDTSSESEAKSPKRRGKVSSMLHKVTKILPKSEKTKKSSKKVKEKASLPC